MDAVVYGSPRIMEWHTIMLEEDSFRDTKWVRFDAIGLEYLTRMPYIRIYMVMVIALCKQ